MKSYKKENEELKSRNIELIGQIENLKSGYNKQIEELQNKEKQLYNDIYYLEKENKELTNVNKVIDNKLVEAHLAPSWEQTSREQDVVDYYSSRLRWAESRREISYYNRANSSEKAKKYTEENIEKEQQGDSTFFWCLIIFAFITLVVTSYN